MYWGGEFILEYADINAINIIGYAADIRLGYTPVNTFLKDFTLYGIGAAMYQSVDDRENSGFGYGAGLEYRVTNNIGINVDYKTFNMTPSNIGFLNYDYTKTGISIKYMF
jgi:opacity protein-like surface antigen